MKNIPISQVFCSTLLRSRQTAQYIRGADEDVASQCPCPDRNDPVVLPGLEEQYLGAWDGLSFREIQRKWPALYEKRGKDRNLLPVGAESDVIAGNRFFKAVDRALAMSEGDIAIVAHRSVIQMMISHTAGEILKERHKYELDYGSVTLMEADDSGESFYIEEIGKIYRPDLSEELCRKLLKAAETPENVIAHCLAVAREAKRIQKELAEAGWLLDGHRIICGSLLHDIARLEEKHADTGAQWLRALGYEEVADLIGQHHDLKDPRNLDEAAVICMADRCVQSDRTVTLAQRFEKSEKKCQNEKAEEAHRRRYEEALWLKAQINTKCGKEVIL